MWLFYEKTNTFRSHQENDHAYIFGILQNLFSFLWTMLFFLYLIQQCQTPYKKCTPYFFSFLWTLWFYAVYDRALFKVHPKSVHILCLSCEPCYFLYEMQQCQSQYKHHILCNLVKTVYNAYYSTLTRKKHESDHNHNFFICEL